MVDHAPFFDVNRQVVLKVLNSCRIFVNQGAQALLFTGNIPRGVFCERRSQKTRDILREFMQLA